MTFDQRTTSHPNKQLLLPVSKSFVVQIEADVEIYKGQFSGRIEHIITGKSIRFNSLKELLAFIEASI